MKNWKKHPNFIKGICLGLAGILAVTSVVAFWSGKLKVNAAKNTLPGIEQLREDYISNTKTYRILEIVPEMSLAELGYYVGGQEPFAQLYDMESGMYRSWQEMLLMQADKEDREAFVAELCSLAEKINTYYEETGIQPFTIEAYREYEPGKQPEDATCLKIDGSVKRGYLQYGGGEWNATFAVLADRNVSLDSINHSVTTPFYKAMNVERAFSYQELMDFAEVCPEEELYIFRPEGYLEYMGNAAEVWAETERYLEELLQTVSGNSVSGGDIVSDIWYESSGLYHPYFALIDSANPVSVGDQVYLMSEAVYMGEDNGDYTLIETQERVEPGEAFVFDAVYLYFTGGLLNNEVFKKEVFGLDEQECDSFRISVEVVTPAMLSALFEQHKITKIMDGAELFADYDFVYVNGGGAMNFIKGNSYSYDTENDITPMILGSLGMYISMEKVPCIFDLQPFVEVDQYGNYFKKESDEAGISQTNLIRLAYFLTKPSYVASGEDIGDEFYYASLDSLIYGSLYGLDVSDASLESLFGEEKLPNRTDPEVEVRDLSFVNDNVWFVCNDPVVTGDNSLRNRGLFSGKEYALEQVKSGFYSVWKEIGVENMYLAEQKKELLDTKIYDASVFRYIINFKNQRLMSKEYLDVLVIEPAGRTSTVSAEEFCGLTNVEAGKITFHVMAMNEFVGKIEDLNASYDIIYLDANTTGLVTENGETVYNDSTMNGLLYSHVGDTVEAFASISGLLDTDYTANNREAGTLKETTIHRYSGNDLSVEKYNALMDYLDANYPIVISSELLKESGMEVNEGRVDNSSYLYEFLNEILQDNSKKNIFVSNTLSENKSAFAFYANRPKLSLHSPEYKNLIMTKEIYLADGESDSNVTQITPRNGCYYLQFDFIIQNDSAANFGDDYTCKLYLDANADGKFSQNYEELALNGGDITEVATGQRVSSTDKLKTGVRYQVSREVPDSFSGCISWQLEVSQTGCPSVRTQYKGYTKLSGSDAAHIKILQIYYHSEKRVINLEQSIGQYKNGAYDNSGMTYVTNYFKEVAQNVSDDYILDIKTISKDVFDIGYYDGEGGEEPIILNEYDMLILGFSDGNNTGMDWNQGIDMDLPCVDASGNVIKDNNIRHFIESGKSVLFAHDMTSTINVADYDMKIGSSLGDDYRLEENKNQIARNFYYAAGTKSFNEYAWGYNINRKLRDLVGMDTYGITGGAGAAVLSRGEELSRSENAWEYLSQSGKYTLDAPYKMEGRYVYDVKDVAFAPGSGREHTVSQVQGFTAYALNMRVYGNEENVGYYRNGLAPNRSNYYATVAEKVNDGQITNYPYLISDLPALAQTHQQYYTLNLNSDSDKDQETDIVVWYNLAGGGYECAPGDVKNNYYIYSKGNVIYTGMGHSASGRSTDEAPYADAVTLEEAKLFINTMVAAYNAGQRSPEIITTTEGGIATDVVYNYYDSLITDSVGSTDYANVTASDDKVEIYYHVDDLNITQGTKKVELHYYMEIDAEDAAELAEAGYSVRRASELPDGAGVMLSDMYLLEVTVYLAPYTSGEDVKANGGYVYVNPGETYRLEIPLKYFDADNHGYRSNFYIGGRTVMTHSSIIDGSLVTSCTPYVYTKLQCVNVELFDLD